MNNELHIIKTFTIYILPLAFILYSCTENIDLKSLGGESKTALFCFPSTDSDSTKINVSHSLPVGNKNIDNSQHNYSLIYKVNGVPQVVNYSNQQNIYYYNGDTGNFQITPLIYGTAAKQKEYDKIEIDVTDNTTGKQVTASTIIPTKPVVGSFSLEHSSSVIRLNATITDDGKTDDYYAVRILSRYYRPYEDNQIYTVQIDPTYEPLINKLSDIDSDFGFDNNFYQDLYIFNDKEIQGKTYKLNLKLNIYYSYNYTSSTGQRYQYKVEIMHIGQELYKYLKSINDINNSDLSTYGLALITPTFTNINGGIGVIAGYSEVDSPWIDDVQSENK